MDAVLQLLNAYHLADPVGTRGVGEFENAAFRSLFSALTTQGASSELEALRVGAEIEELDLADIDKGLAEVSEPNIHSTMEALKRGSRNHLRAFYAQLQSAGSDYVPKHLDETTVRAIVKSPKETGQ